MLLLFFVLVVVVPSCPEGYELRFPYCLRISSDRVGYYAAKQSCINEGATLAFARNSDEFVNDITRYFGSVVGIAYFWTDGYAANQECVARGVGVLINGFRYNLWQSWQCSTQFHYMCMKWAAEVKPFQYLSASSQRNGDYFPIPGQSQYFRARYQQRGGRHIFQYFTGKIKFMLL